MAKSRSSTRRQIAAQRARKRRQRQLAVLLGVAGIAVIIVVALILTSQSSATISAENVGDYSAFPQGIDEDGAPFIGEEDAPVTLTEYSDFACPHCATWAEQVHLLIDTYVADGTLKIVYKLVSFVNPQTSPTAASAGLCAAEQDKFWEMHDGLYGLLNTQGSAAFTRSTMNSLAGELGLDEDEFSACLTSGETRQTVQSVASELQQVNVTGTPTVFVNGERIDPNVVPYTFDGMERLILQLAS